MIRIIRTRYHGPTDSKGSRISATDLRTGERIVRPYDHALDDVNNHNETAGALERRLRGLPEGASAAKHWYGVVEETATHDRFHAFENEES